VTNIIIPFKCSHSLVRNRKISSKSRGALAGGFTKEGLKYWASQHWKPSKAETQPRSSRLTEDETPPYYCDLYSHKVSRKCINWLEEQSNPSVLLTRAFFGSTYFTPEKILFTPFFHAQSTSSSIKDAPLNMNDQYLAWTVQVTAPHELILTYDLGTNRGCTMIAFDPSLQKVYTGNCIDIDPDKASRLWNVLLYFHHWYANFLLKGMVLQLEKTVSKVS
jgi:hypothetical protein